MTTPPPAAADSPPPAPADAKAQQASALVARVALGDRKAFERLYALVGGQLLGVVLRINGNRAEAEEILQEVFVNIWRGARSFEAARNTAMGWLVSVARYRAIDSLRQRSSSLKTVSTTVPDDEFDWFETVPSPLPGPAEVHEQAASEQQLTRCLQVLSADQRQVLALAYFQGYTHAEVAQHLAQPLGSVKSWVRRGLMALQRCMGVGPTDTAGAARG